MKCLNTNKKVITISVDTWSKLMRLKAKFKARSFDQVINMLISKFEDE